MANTTRTLAAARVGGARREGRAKRQVTRATESHSRRGSPRVWRAWGSGTSFSDAGSVSTKGAGFRYQIARRLGLYVGLDVAKGPEDTAIYIQAGSAWR